MNYSPQQLFSAVVSNDVATIQSSDRGLLARALAEDGSGATLLHRCMSTTMSDLLVSFGISVNAQDGRGCTPLHEASRGGRQDVVEALLRKGAQVDATNRDQQTPLHCASTAAVARTLVDRGCDVNAVDNDGRSPLHLAAYWNRDDVCKILFAAGADVTLRDRSQKLAWDVAGFRVRSSPSLRTLLAGDSHARDAPIVRATKAAALDVIALFARRGPEVLLCKTDHGRTSLHVAAAGGNAALCRSILGLADIGLQNRMVAELDSDQRTPLHLASTADSAAALLEFHAAVNAKDGSGNTPLHLAAANGAVDVCSVLLRCGAEARLKNTRGEIPGDVAAENVRKDDALWSQLAPPPPPEVNRDPTAMETERPPSPPPPATLCSIAELNAAQGECRKIVDTLRLMNDTDTAPFDTVCQALDALDVLAPSLFSPIFVAASALVRAVRNVKINRRNCCDLAATVASAIVVLVNLKVVSVDGNLAPVALEQFLYSLKSAIGESQRLVSSFLPSTSDGSSNSGSTVLQTIKRGFYRISDNTADFERCFRLLRDAVALCNTMTLVQLQGSPLSSPVSIHYRNVVQKEFNHQAAEQRLQQEVDEVIAQMQQRAKEASRAILQQDSGVIDAALVAEGGAAVTTGDGNFCLADAIYYKPGATSPPRVVLKRACLMAAAGAESNQASGRGASASPATTELFEELQFLMRHGSSNPHVLQLFGVVVCPASGSGSAPGDGGARPVVDAIVLEWTPSSLADRLGSLRETERWALTLQLVDGLSALQKTGGAASVGLTAATVHLVECGAAENAQVRFTYARPSCGATSTAPAATVVAALGTLLAELWCPAAVVVVSATASAASRFDHTAEGAATRTIQWPTLQRTAPPAIYQLVKLCCTPDPRHRVGFHWLHSLHDVRDLHQVPAWFPKTAHSSCCSVM